MVTVWRRKEQWVEQHKHSNTNTSASNNANTPGKAVCMFCIPCMELRQGGPALSMPGSKGGLQPSHTVLHHQKVPPNILQSLEGAQLCAISKGNAGHVQSRGMQLHLPTSVPPTFLQEEQRTGTKQAQPCCSQPHAAHPWAQ